jgi:DNA polymerase/3'-5' exonuclease PolX
MPTELENYYNELLNLKETSQNVEALIKCYNDHKDQADFEDINCEGGKKFKDLYDAVQISNTQMQTYGEFEQDIENLKANMNTTLNNTDLEDTHKNVKELRNKLDNKMREIYHPELQDAYVDHSAQIYMSLAWTVMAASVLYFLIHQLD